MAMRPAEDAVVTNAAMVRLPGFARAIVAAMLLVPLLTSLAVPAGAAQDDASLRIGTLFPFTGDLSDFGPAFFNAAELAAGEINEAGGVNGQPIELVRGDTATSPQQAVEEARRLIDIEGVNAIVGPAASGVALQVVESVAGPNGVLVISPSATSPALTVANDDDFFFRTTISDAAQGVVLADLAREQGFASACLLYVNNAYGQGLSEAFTNRFEAEGGQVTGQVAHEQEQASYQSELASCTDTNPDVLVGISYPESGGVYLRELVESGNAPALILSDGLRSDTLFADLGWDTFEGTMGTSPGSPETDTGTTFQSAFEAAYGEYPPYPYLREVYDAVYLISLAAEAAGSNDSTAIRDALRDVAAEGTPISPGTEGFGAGLEALANGEDINYEGAAGAVDFDENGDVSKGTIQIWQVENGEIVNVDSRDIDLTAEGAAAAAATPVS